MYLNSDIATQLAQLHHKELLAEAEKNRLSQLAAQSNRPEEGTLRRLWNRVRLPAED